MSGREEDRVARMARREREHRERLAEQEAERQRQAAEDAHRRHAVAARKLELRWQGVTDEEVTWADIAPRTEAAAADAAAAAQLDDAATSRGKPGVLLASGYLRRLDEQRERRQRSDEEAKEEAVHARLEELYDSNAATCKVTRRNTNEEVDARLLSKRLRVGDVHGRMQARQRQVGQAADFWHLPDELWLHILSMLPRARDLQHCRASGREMRRIASDDSLWLCLLESQFPQWVCRCHISRQEWPLVEHFMEAVVRAPWNEQGLVQEMDMGPSVAGDTICALSSTSLPSGGFLLAVCRGKGGVTLTTLPDGWGVGSRAAGHLLPASSTTTVVLPTDAQTCVAVGAGGQLVATGGADGKLHVCEVASRRCVYQEQLHIGPLVGVAFLQGTGSLLAYGKSSASVVSLASMSCSILDSSEALCWAGAVAPSMVAAVGGPSVRLYQDGQLCRYFHPEPRQGTWEAVYAGGGEGLVVVVVRSEGRDCVLAYDVQGLMVGDVDAPAVPLLQADIGDMAVEQVGLISVQAGRLVFLAGMGQGDCLKTMRLDASGSESRLLTASWTTQTWLPARPLLLTAAGGTLLARSGGCALLVVHPGKRRAVTRGCVKHGGRLPAEPEAKPMPWEEVAAQFAPLAPW